MLKKGLYEAFLRVIFIEDLFEMCKTQIPGFVDHTGVAEHVACAYKTSSEAFT